MYFKTLYCVFVFILLIVRTGLSQDPTMSGDYSVNIISPTASALGKYVDFPVNLHTGVPSISIPIHQLKEGPLQLPIALKYHAAGLKVMEVPSWIGAGWSLDAGGVVSRTVRGLPDDQVGSLNSSGVTEGSFYRDHGFSSYFTEPEAMTSVPVTSFHTFGNGQKDGEPDLFFFNFAGYSGEFYINEAQEPVLIPASDIKIELILKPGGLTYSVKDYFQGFKITTPDGTKYYFGITGNNLPATVDPVEKTAVAINTVFGTYTSYEKVISSWYLHKVESADGLFEIDLTYESERYSHYTVGFQPCIINCDASMDPIKLLYDGLRLSSIVGTNESVDFVPQSSPREDLVGYDAPFPPTTNTESYALKEIVVNSSYSDYCKSFVLTQSYFQSTEPAPDRIDNIITSAYVADQKRLKLESVREVDCENLEEKPPHVLQYYQSSQVPRRLSFAQDHWGFFNGALSNATMLPSYSTDNGATEMRTGNGIYGSADREASFPSARAGALQFITYPTGGRAEFLYEANQVTTYDEDCVNLAKGSSAGSSLAAGMSNENPEFGNVVTISVANADYYHFELQAQGTSASGRMLMNGSVVLENNTGNTTVETFYYLLAGTYDFQLYANADASAGVGMIGLVSHTTGSCTVTPIVKDVGGLRIEQIKHIDPVSGSPTITKQYDYADAQLYSIPRYIAKLKNHAFTTGFLDQQSMIANSGCRVNSPNSPIQTFQSPSSTHPMQSTQGYHIGYGTVTETQSDGGYTISSFAGQTELPAGWGVLRDVSVRIIDADVCLAEDPPYPPPPNEHFFDRGHQTAKKYFTATGKLLMEETSLPFYEPFGNPTFGLSAKIVTNLGATVPTFYQVQSQRLSHTNSGMIVYDPNDANKKQETIIETKYEGNGHQQVTSRSSDNITRGIEKSEFRYPPDLTNCVATSGSCYQDFLAAKAVLDLAYGNNVYNCDVGSLIATCAGFTNVDGVIMSQCDVYQSGCRTAAYHQYHYDLNELRKTYSSCLQGLSDGQNCIDLGMSRSNPAGAIYRLQDINQIGIPIEVTTSRNNEVVSSTYSQYVKDLTNANGVYLDKVFKFENEFGVNDFQGAQISGHTVTIDSDYSNSPEVAVKFENGQIVERTDRSGVVTSYIWGYDGTVPIVVAVGVDYNTLNTAFSNNPEGFRSDPTLQDAQITTYTHDPVVGITSETDPNGVTRIYDYDRLGRLESIRDQDRNVLTQYEYNYPNE